MQANNHLLKRVDDVMDAKYGKVATPDREQFRRDAYLWYMGQVLHNARKSEKINTKISIHRFNMPHYQVFGLLDLQK